MNAGSDRRLLVAWLVLSAITIASLSVGLPKGRGAPGASTAITFSVIGTALIKVRIILREFMEVRHAPVRLGRLTDAWLLLTGVILLGAYAVGMAFATR